MVVVFVVVVVVFVLVVVIVVVVVVVVHVCHFWLKEKTLDFKAQILSTHWNYVA